MSTITKQWLQQKIADMEATRDEIPFGLDEDDSNTLAALRIALASLDAEPVGEVALGEYDDSGCQPDARVVCIAADGQADWENFKDGTRLYAVNPAQVSIDERAAFNAWNNDENLPIAGVGAKNAAWLAWQARAKLIAPPGPVSVPDEITFEKIAEITASQGYEYSINECICAASWWNACRAAMLQGADGNSPVIPDCWADMLQRWLVFGRGMQNAGSQLPRNLISETEAMLAAAPRQETSNDEN